MSILTLTDGYKLDHRRQYPPKTTRVYSNWTPRMSRILNANGVVFFGLQYYLQEYMGRRFREFFNTPRDRVAKEYQELLLRYLGPNQIGVEHVLALHDLRYVPLEFRALPEGSFVPLRVPAFTVENTHDDFAWLTNYFETLMSAVLWKPCTSATQAGLMRNTLDRAARETGGDLGFVPWQSHDFSFRGMSGPDDAMASGAAHLLSFTGTDTLPTLEWVDRYYPGDNGLLGMTVPATEHSVMCAGGKETELQTFERLLELYPTGILSVVSDTWDLWKVLTGILPKLKDKILARDGKLVIRPDSGDPVSIICGDKAAANEPARKGVIELLWDLFGGTVNEKGFKQLDPHIGAIYGDSINRDRAYRICEQLKQKGFASTNIVFGVGSYCVTSETPILCSDLIWRSAGSLKAGQEIVAFDEDPSFGAGRHAARCYRLATITNNEPAQKDCLEVVTDIGDPVSASHDHPWLVWTSNRSAENVFYSGRVPTGFPRNEVPRGPGLVWKKTDELVIGDQIAFLGKPWRGENDRSSGWLEGIFDGEGCLSRSTGDDRIPSWKVNVSQNEGPVLDRIKSELRSRGFSFYVNERKCPQVTLTGGWLEVLRFLGTVAPQRLRDKLSRMWQKMPALKRASTFKLATVTAIHNRGRQLVASITTSCGTFVTGGYLSHNTYQYVTRDTFGFAVKTTWAEVDGEGHDLYKKPVTDDGVKNSATGRLAVATGADGRYRVIERASPGEASALELVWRNGIFHRTQSFAEVRKNALNSLKWNLGN